MKLLCLISSSLGVASHHDRLSQFSLTLFKLACPECHFQRDIAESSLGYPYFTHFLARESITAMFARDSSSRLVVTEDYNFGKENAAKKVYRHYLKKYKPILQKLTQNEIGLLRQINKSKRIDISRDLLENRKK